MEIDDYIEGTSDWRVRLELASMSDEGVDDEIVCMRLAKGECGRL